jgi:uncharacterized membrane protein YkvA (DUF1232 family)
MTKARGLTKYLPRAARYARDPKKLAWLLKAVMDYARDNRGPIKAFLADLRLLINMVVDWSRGRYRVVPAKSIVLVVAALLYFLSPLDLIPDFLPGGFLDDAAVVAWVLKSVSADVGKYREWARREAKQ